MGKTPKPPKRKVYGSYEGAKAAATEPDGDTPLFSANEMQDVARAAFDIGMSVVQAMGDNGGVFVTREVDPDTDQAVYYFDSYEKYRLVKEDSDG